MEELDKTQKNYHAVLIRLMSFLNEQAYDDDHVFSQDELASLQPADIERWMSVQAYGIPQPGPNANPTLARSNSLKYWKKGISFFMPNKLMAWNALSGVGNPTRSLVVNQLIKKVKKKEVRKQGAATKTKRAMTFDEFKSMVDVLVGKVDIIRRYGIPCFVKFQFHLIARIDDTTQFLMENLTENPDFDFTLRSKLRWSKNVNEERDAPNQFLIGAMDPWFCVLLALAVTRIINKMKEDRQAGIVHPSLQV
jgi:hypothetical protein